MSLTCPDCGVRFKVKDGAIGKIGRKVKCGKCGHRWFATPDVARPAASSTEVLTDKIAVSSGLVGSQASSTTELSPKPDTGNRANESYGKIAETRGSEEIISDPPPIPPEASIGLRSVPKSKESGRTVKIWMLLLLILIGGATASIVWRNTIVHHLPIANELFSILGFPVETLGFGLKISDPSHTLVVENEQRVLKVSGEITNGTGRVIKIPYLKAVLFNVRGEEIKSWIFEANHARILPGTNVKYETSAENPPPGATRLQVTFAHALERSFGSIPSKLKGN